MGKIKVWRLDPKKAAKFFSTRPYEVSQPYVTYLRPGIDGANKTRILNISGKIRALVPHPENRIGVEIGPGDAPVLSGIPFKRTVYVDGSPAIAAQLKKYGDVRQSAGVIAGDIRNLPITKRQRAGIIAVNEVFAHLWPRERLPALKEIAERADALLIIDRPAISFRRFREKLAEEGRAALELLKGKRVPEAELELHKFKINMPLADARLAYARLVDFREIRDYLKNDGWEVWAEEDKEGSQRYVILTAKRKEL
ncbi:MAG: hypothetical protein V1676_05760 [Candidatus Diapherotrites archaeon]